MKRTPHANRPKWAKSLTAQEWKHICEGQQTKTATLLNLILDSETCPECKWILDSKLEGYKECQWILDNKLEGYKERRNLAQG